MKKGIKDRIKLKIYVDVEKSTCIYDTATSVIIFDVGMWFTGFSFEVIVMYGDNTVSSGGEQEQVS